MTADGEVVMYTAGVINQEELEIDPKSVAGTSTAESHQVGKKPPTGISRTPQKRNKSAHSSGQKLCSPVDRVDNIPSILDSGTLSTEAEHSTDGPRSVDHQTLTLQDEEGIRAAKRQRTERKRKWVECDITPKPERTWQMPGWLEEDNEPVDMFQLFFDDDVITLLVDSSIQYALQTGNAQFTISKNEKKMFLAILFLSGYCTMARRRMYWETAEDVHHPGVAKAMSRNRFEEIIRYFQCV